MESQPNNPPLVVIVGQTASGKSALALRIAKDFHGEIIAADSRTVYKGMDIGTAKPSQQERAEVRHHLIDVVRPDQPFSVADFQQAAKQAITEISGNSKLPILVGGSGLYIDAVIYNFGLRAAPDFGLRKELEMLSVDELRQRLLDEGIPLPTNEHNPRHLIRTLETGGALPIKHSLRTNTLILGLQVDREQLEERIGARVEVMVAAGFVDEVKMLARQYGWDKPSLQAPGYRAFRGYAAGEISLEEAKAQFIQNDMQYAKRQKTWFKRNPEIHWINKTAEAVDLVTTFLSK